MTEFQVFIVWCSLGVVSMLDVQLCERLPSPNGESTVNCNALSTMPKVSFTIAGKAFELAPEEVSLRTFCWILLDLSKSLVSV